MELIDSMIALSILLGFYSCVLGEKFPRLKATSGIMEGTYRKSNLSRSYEAYEGIPYAELPVGYGRFEPPIARKDWGSAILIAKQLGKPCIQWDEITDTIIGSEDCLFLNIYRPSRSYAGGDTGLPIIFYIHGPDFQTGSGGSGVKYLMDRSVIVVTFNYRLGPFGFLSTRDRIVPGNMGLKDQVLALKWIQKNAASIGGEPTEVTIIGHGAGGASVHYHYLSPQTDRLFRNGMSLSGTALAPWARARAPLQNAKKLADLVNCPTSDNRKMVDCLKGVPFHDILAKCREFKVWLRSPYAPWGPVVENWVTDSTYITRSALEYILTGKVKDLPWIVGIVSHEGTAVVGSILAKPMKFAEMNEKYGLIAGPLFSFNYTVPEWKHSLLGKWIKDNYLGDYPIADWTFYPIIKMLGDRLFVISSVQAALLQARTVKGPVRFMRFTYLGKYSYAGVESGSDTAFGVAHGDDFAYVFESFVDKSDVPLDDVMRRKMIDIWHGYVARPDSQPNVDVIWPHVGKNVAEFDYLHIYRPADIIVENSKGLGERDFWASLDIQEELSKVVKKPKLNASESFYYQNHIKPCVFKLRDVDAAKAFFYENEIKTCNGRNARFLSLDL